MTLKNVKKLFYNDMKMKEHLEYNVLILGYPVARYVGTEFDFVIRPPICSRIKGSLISENFTL